jgi:hypothetical protein
MPRPRQHKLHPFGSFLGPPPPPHGGPHHGPPDGPHHGPPHGPHHPPHVEWPFIIDEPSSLNEAATFLADIFTELAESGAVVLSDDVTVSPPTDVHLVVRHAVVDGQRALEAALIWRSTDDTETGTTTLASALAKRKSRQPQSA